VTGARETTVTRRRSASSQENDERLLEAALDEISGVGIDRLGMSSVARRARLTTGALYGRYENVHELAAEVWTRRVRDTQFEFLDRAVRCLVDRDPSIALAEVVSELSAPTRTTLAALELLATARRIDELDEIVGPDVAGWLLEWGAGPRARDGRRRAQVLFTLGSLWGVLIHAIPRAHPVDWPAALAVVGQSYTRPYDVPASRFAPERTSAVRAETGDRSESALIDSVSKIAARVGFERATTSRIARRAGFTSGAIYARYRAKDELLTRAVDVLLAQRLSDDLAANQQTYFRSPNLGAATARTVGGFLTPARREWRHFRIEAQLAARHRPNLAATLDRIQEDAIKQYLLALGATTEAEQRALDGLARFAQCVPLGLAFVDLVAPGNVGVDWRSVFVPLLAPGP
jgi:AcrR family transcriptional regulator